MSAEMHSLVLDIRFPEWTHRAPKLAQHLVLVKTTRTGACQGKAVTENKLTAQHHRLYAVASA